MEFEEYKIIHDRILERCYSESLFDILDSEFEFSLLSYTQRYKLLKMLNLEYFGTIEYQANDPLGISESVSYLYKKMSEYYLKGKKEDTIIQLKEIEGKNNKINFLTRKKADHIHDGYPIESLNFEGDIFHDYLKTEIEYWQNFIEPEPYKGEKIKWLGTPSQFGFLFSELVKKHYIEPPKTFAEPSYAKYAKICMEVFDINTTEGNLAKELNPAIGKNTLSDTKKEKFTIPEILDIS
jgi:hypothetical protein